MDTTFNRRTFLATTTAAAASIVLPVSPLLAQPERKRGPICLFSKHLQWMEYDEMADAAAEIGFDGVSLTVRPRGHVLPKDVEKNLPRAVEALKGAGLTAPMMTTAINDPAHRHTEPILRTASELGIRYYRMGYLSYDDNKSVTESLDDHRGLLSELAALNQEFAIHGAYQNHAGTRVGGPVWDIHYMLQGLDPQWIGCQYDIRHATVEGGTSWPIGLRLVAPYVKITAIKDFYWKQKGKKWNIENVPLGEGAVDFKKYAQMTRSLDIEGPISVHFEYKLPYDINKNNQVAARKETIQVMKRDVDFLKNVMDS